MWRSRSSLILVMAGILGTGSAQAQIADGFALDRYDPSERGSDWFDGDSLDMRGDLRGGLGIVGDYGYRPLVLYRHGKDSVPIIKHQLFTHVGGTLILWNRLRLGMNFPLLLINTGDNARVGGTLYSASGGVKAGDLRFGADIRLVGEYREPFSLAIGVKAHLPTGNVKAYASDGKVRLEPRILAAGDIGPFVYAARISFNYRALHGQVTGDPFGNEIGFGASAGVRIFDDLLVIGPELFGATVVQKSSGVFGKMTAPLELVFSGKFRIAQTFIGGLGVGPGLTRGYGAPALRLLASFEWFPDVEKPEPVQAPKDRDNDGIVDSQDACPDEPGLKSDDPKKNGCPAPKDTDGDGVADTEDACPDQAGEKNDDPKKNGCPSVVMTDEQIEVNERIEFDTNKATLRPESNKILTRVLNVILAHPEITKLSIGGHTDNVGTPRYNKKLSARRAAAVVRWLVKHGVAKSRLRAESFGQNKPVGDNNTESGRQNNRRVDFLGL
jgi:outer membrane protein OmpA-like peptidoglycan-associated protein